MPKLRHRARMVVALVVLLFSVGSHADAIAEKMVIIINNKNALKSLTESELARIYKGQKIKWSNGQLIYLIHQPLSSPMRQVFYRRILGEPPSKQFFRKGSPRPIQYMVARSERSAKLFVARIPNAIAYIHAEAVDESVKVLLLEDYK